MLRGRGGEPREAVAGRWGGDLGGIEGVWGVWGGSGRLLRRDGAAPWCRGAGQPKAKASKMAEGLLPPPCGTGPPPGCRAPVPESLRGAGGSRLQPRGGPGGAGRREAGGEGLVLAGLWLPPWGARCEAGGGTARTAWGGAPEEVLVQQGGEIPCEGLASLRASFILGFTRTAPAQCLVLHHGKCQWHGSGGRFISSIRLSGRPAYPSCRNVL